MFVVEYGVRELVFLVTLSQEAADSIFYDWCPEKLLDGGSFLGVYLKHGADELFHFRGVLGGNRIEFSADNFESQEMQTFCVEGGLLRAEFVEDNSQTPDIGGEGVGFSFDDFR